MIFKIEPGARVRQYGTMTLAVGDKAFKKKMLESAGLPNWEGDDAREIVRAFIKGSYASYDYPGAGSRHFEGKTSLIGFTEAWNIAVDYVGMNPLEE